MCYNLKKVQINKLYPWSVFGQLLKFMQQKQTPWNCLISKIKDQILIPFMLVFTEENLPCLYVFTVTYTHSTLEKWWMVSNAERWQPYANTKCILTRRVLQTKMSGAWCGNGQKPAFQKDMFLLVLYLTKF